MSDAKTVLVADDNEDIVMLISFRLERAGYSVVRAGDGAQALELAVEHRPDMAILDLMMPKLNGYEVTQRIRAHGSIGGMPIVLLTARAQESDVARGFEAGADDYMRKPFSPQELLARVQAILGRR